MENIYLCIDLKSFYASVECVERGLDPMTTNLVVADPERSEKTICLAVSPSMKALGVKNRCRVFEIPDTIKYIMAPPRMQKYIDYAARIYEIYLKYVSSDDVYVYSIDEAFLDVTHYLKSMGLTARQLAVKIMDDIYTNVGVRATCGIGTNLYLTKIALDITAKHSKDFIGYLDEELFIKTLWDHQPLTDFWRIGKGTAEKLERMGIYTMRHIAQMDEDILYRAFGVDAELLIDHSRGIEPVTMADIKAYKPKSNCLTSGQVLGCSYAFEDAKLAVREMMDSLCLDMTRKGLVTSSVTLHVGYDNKYKMAPAHGTARIGRDTNNAAYIMPEVLNLFDGIVDRDFLVKRINITCNNVTEDDGGMQISLFDKVTDEKDKKIQELMNDIKDRFGKNTILKATSLEETSTAMERNLLIGGHKSGNEKK